MLMNHCGTGKTGIGDLVDERLTRSSAFVAGGDGLDALPGTSGICDRSSCPRVEKPERDVVIA